eukprot:6481880-Amphidinium_carterae.1
MGHHARGCWRRALTRGATEGCRFAKQPAADAEGAAVWGAPLLLQSSNGFWSSNGSQLGKG